MSLALVLLALTAMPTEGAAATVAAVVNPLGAEPAPGPGPNEVGAVVHDTVAGGTHWRLMTDRGPVHVWRPPSYDQKTAGILVYLHGYYTNADEAWGHHGLAEQFRQCRRNALFVVPEAPVHNMEKVRWDEPDLLLETVKAMTHQSVPTGPLSLMGHSGGFRTILTWLSSPRVEQVILLDGLYNNEADFLAWLKADPKPPSGRRMVVVGFETAERSEAFVTNFPEALVREGVPETPGEFKRRERQAKVLYVRSQFDHMALVTEGRAIPVLLRLAPFRPL